MLVSGLPVPRPWRILVADDDEVFACTLARLVRRDPQFELVGIAADTESAIDTAVDADADVAVVDVGLPGGGGRAVAVALRGRRTRVIAVSGVHDCASVCDMLCAGASAYLGRGAPWSELQHTMREVAGGHARLSAAVLDNLVSGLEDEIARRSTGAADAETQRDRVLVQRVIDDRALRMVWQPIVDIGDGTVIGAEALSRFADHAFLGPAGWFAAADRAGLRAELEILAIERALGEIAMLPEPAFAAVNLSAALVGDPRLDGLLRGVEDRVVVELSEQVRVTDYAALMESLAELRGGGVRIAIDDAGAGFSSMRHVVELTPEIIKLDLSLVCGIDQDRRRRAMTAALVGFAAEIGARVVAEGVQRPEELAALGELGVRFAQGWLLGEPAPIGELAAVMSPAAAG